MAAVALPHRLYPRHNSPKPATRESRYIKQNKSTYNEAGMGESDSDDEPPPAIKFSKVTQALLADAPALSSPPKQADDARVTPFVRSNTTNRVENSTPSRAPSLRIVRKQSPTSPGEARRITPSRIVHVNPGTGVKRSTSISGLYSSHFGSKREPTPTRDAHYDLITPAPSIRHMTVVTRSRANSNASQEGRGFHAAAGVRPGARGGSAALSDNEHDLATKTGQGSTDDMVQEDPARFAALAPARSRNNQSDVLPPGSQRVKRAPISGSFLRSGPVRRGFRRRESDDNASPVDDLPTGSVSSASAYKNIPRERSLSRPRRPESRNGVVEPRIGFDEPISTHDFAQRGNNNHHESRPSSRQAHGTFSSTGQTGGPGREVVTSAAQHSSLSRQPSVERLGSRRRPSEHHDQIPSTAERPQPQSAAGTGARRTISEQKPPQRAPSLRPAQYRYVGSKMQAGDASDQENVPPPTFKRNKDQEFKYLGDPVNSGERAKVHSIDETPAPIPGEQLQRKVLGALSGNTPHRTAPAPPPKMSVLETATATAGASVVKSKKKRSHIVINGKIFTQMSKIGKGGSSDVYCVMAENHKTFALKRVKLDDCDESAVKGFKGEIDLLKKLTDVDRVVRLFDWELNEERQELCVLMEKGESDLNRLLTIASNGGQASLDNAFVRYHWREMLECVQAVHEQDIVHSDLKPANFLLVQGRLKLIDFGIANAIDTDNTCNVHRDTHVGTPNYMSPESITDTNADLGGRDAAGRPVKKDMKIGKASDVWSLGCILYQMAYGRAPFAHIPNQISRIMAITNPNHVIEFPATGVGKAPVLPSLRRVLRKCLDRNPDKRPTCAQLLDDNDVFLNPEAGGAIMVNEALLGQILVKVVDRCCDPTRPAPTPEEVQQYSKSFMERIREMVEKG